ncbi:hypothetical protein GDO78_015507 [Eleutherodactylus coqui]|uniref:Uncharacterized protein n=1 Tax=Eleutherodactylus coqui TaxID=57060 RepID=A0A8J6BE33_ELECQ|nr:hypothetical protein GDO78_015507 [Eleutherodactylus coqui]
MLPGLFDVSTSLYRPPGSLVVNLFYMMVVFARGCGGDEASGGRPRFVPDLPLPGGLQLSGRHPAAACHFKSCISYCLSYGVQGSDFS